MLVRFAVQNYLSFNERTEFNMLTGSPRRLSHHVYHRNDLELLKMAAVYGANGAGKSNFLRAFTDFRNFVLAGESAIFPFHNIRKFRLNTQNKNLPILFEIEFLVEKTIFYYTVSINNSIIINEKLEIAQKGRNDNLIFERTLVNNKLSINFNEQYKKSDEDKLRIKLYEEEILTNNELLLTKLQESREGFNIVKQVYSWFTKILSIRPSFSLNDSILIYKSVQDFTKDYISKFHTGINDFEVVTYSLEQYLGESKYAIEAVKNALTKESSINLNSILGLKENFKDKTIATIENEKYVIKTLITYHLNEKGEKVSFSPTEESDGSIRLLELLEIFYFVTKEPILMIVDEIESSIHPYLLKELITKFSENKETKGQLIFTTHESNLLDQEIFRQDEIWFAEKNTEGATEMYPMSDFDVRYDLDIRKGYLNGRFGAIPFLGNFTDLNWKADVE